MIGGQQQGLPSLLGSSAPTNGYTSALESSIPIRNASLGCLNEQYGGSLQSSEQFNGEVVLYFYQECEILGSILRKMVICIGTKSRAVREWRLW